ncbi:hypothetical protein DL346_11855 [Paenibacillus montanisoli]|uniref:Uncharacterized protein n=1 Tax=Paenibacillus montanisoli TaxID=2081970 RepID=A0A328U0A2_9BACL|nr:hypothetical protein DL346_11855 [Paenibacillus montanisoli]
MTGRFYFNARGGKYVGAVKVNGAIFGIPKIDPAGVNCCSFAQYTVQPGDQLFMDIEFTVGGAASTPVAILCTTI